MSNNLPSFFVGFDDLFNELKQFHHNTGAKSYPPHNLIQISDSEYVLELALAGYSRDDIEIEVKDKTMSVRTRDSYITDYVEKLGDNVKVLHKEISSKRFEKTFALADDMIVGNADMNNGILRIGLEKIIPEEKRPRLISIS